MLEKRRLTGEDENEDDGDGGDNKSDGEGLFSLFPPSRYHSAKARGGNKGHFAPFPLRPRASTRQVEKLALRAKPKGAIL